MSNETRGYAIKERMASLGLGPVRLAAESGVNRKTIARAIAGEASDRVYRDIEEALDRLEGRVGPEEPSSRGAVEEGGRVTFRLTGIYGAREVVVEGPVDKLDEIEASVERLLRGNGDQGA